MTLLHAALAMLLYQKWHLGLILFRLCIYFLCEEFDIKYRYVTIYMCVCVCFVQWGCFDKDECAPLCSTFVTPHVKGILLPTHLSFSECTSEFLKFAFLVLETFSAGYEYLWGDIGFSLCSPGSGALPFPLLFSGMDYVLIKISLNIRHLNLVSNHDIFFS